MEILVQREIKLVLTDLMDRYETYEWAVAWASFGFGVTKLLSKHSSRIRRLVVGMHFHQTHPDFLEHFYGVDGVRFVMSPQGVFHPKVYLFSNGDGDWEALIGSANLTRSAFESNQETVVRVRAADDPSGAVLEKLRSSITEYWKTGRRISRAEVDEYRRICKLLIPVRNQLAGKFGPPRKNPSAEDASLLETNLTTVKWPVYMRAVRTDPFSSFAMRLSLVEAVREWFLKTSHFKDMDTATRKRVAGTTYESKTPQDWLFFGSMKGAGNFKKLIGDNNLQLSEALDAIPLGGDVTRVEYDRFMDRFASAFEDMERGAEGLATATRLLAMKRPDQFVCLDRKNQRELCRAFGLSVAVDRDTYWDGLVARIRKCVWWNSEPPSNPQERGVWQARAAFLDSLFYRE